MSLSFEKIFLFWNKIILAMEPIFLAESLGLTVL